MPDAVQAAVERSKAAMVVLDRHRGAIFPHIAVLLQTFGPAHTRNIVSGAVEAVILAAQKTGYPIGDSPLLDHWRADDAVVVPFPEEKP